MGFAAVQTIDWQECDFYIYARQSDKQSRGNQSTGMQTEDVPLEVEQTFGISLGNHPYVRQFYENLSAADTDVTLSISDEGIGLSGFRRDEFSDLLRTLKERWDATGRMPVICGFSLNRIGRSPETVFLLRTLARDVRWSLRIWTANQPGTIIDPKTKQGQLLLWAACDLGGRDELDTKSDFVRNAKLRIAKRESNRSLGERRVGYRTYPCDSLGNRISSRDANFQEQFDHYRFERDPKEVPMVRDAFQWALQDHRPRKIAQMLQRKYGNHPKTNRPWRHKVVRMLLGHRIYVGERRYNLYSNSDVGSKIRIRNPDEKIQLSPYDETLRIVSDETFHAVQGQLDAWGRQYGKPGEKRRGGRPLKKPLYFHRTKLLRCATCGAPFRVRRNGTQYQYVCNYMWDSRGLPTCQSHDAEKIDALIHKTMRESFAPLEEYRKSLQRELSNGSRKTELKLLEGRLYEERSKLSEIKSTLFRLGSTGASDRLLKEVQEDFDTQAEVVDELQDQVNRFGHTEVDKQRKEITYLLDGMAAFDMVEFSRRKKLLSKLFGAIWVWPDGKLWPQWKGVPKIKAEDQCVSETGRRLRIAKEWTEIDMVRLEEHTKRLIQEGEISYESFPPYGVSTATLYHWISNGRDSIPSTVLKLYTVAKAQYIDMPRLRKDLRDWALSKLEAGSNRERITKEMGIAGRTAKKIVEGGSVRKDSIVKAASVLGDLEKYRELPSWLYRPNNLEQILSWSVYHLPVEEVFEDGHLILPASETVQRGTRADTFTGGEGIVQFPSLMGGNSREFGQRVLELLLEPAMS